MRARRPFFAVLGTALVVVGLVVLGAVLASNARFTGSNGERIYYTATNDRGERIRYQGNLNAFGPGMMMDDRLSCASCHGADGQGGVHTMHMQVMESPDIRWSVLTGEEAGDAHDGTGEHAHGDTDYGLAEFRMAVVEGRHPDGEPLSTEMPRWNIGSGDLEDLAEFLKSSDLAERGESMMPGSFSMDGIWIIFPILGLIMMVMFIVFMAGRMGGFFPRRDFSDPTPRSRPGEMPDSETPLTILKTRYVKGEISKEEYEEMRSELQ